MVFGMSFNQEDNHLILKFFKQSLSLGQLRSFVILAAYLFPYHNSVVALYTTRNSNGLVFSGSNCIQPLYHRLIQRCGHFQVCLDSSYNLPIPHFGHHTFLNYSLEKTVEIKANFLSGILSLQALLQLKSS